MKFKTFMILAWQLPQHILGAIVKQVCEAKPITTYKDAIVYSWDMPGGMSLGKYIFVPFTAELLTPAGFFVNKKYADQMIKHEYGHTKQSKILGWLYLLVIGLPSLIWAGCFVDYRAKSGKSYYSFYTEKWADKLAGIERSENEKQEMP